MKPVINGEAAPQEAASKENLKHYKDTNKPLESKDSAGKINYIKLINWTWDTLPYTDGYKASYCILFLGIVDSINRNRWAKTNLPYDYLINKCKISKQVYLDARQWLVNNGFLVVEVGKNGYMMASFELGIEVRNQTATDTAISTAIDTPIDTPVSTATDTATNTYYKTVKLNKPETSKPKTINIEFEQFWILYDKRKGKVAAEKEWQKLTDEERESVMQHVPEYNRANEKQYRQDPKRYLKEKTFNDEIIKASTNKKNHSVTLQSLENGQRAKL